MCLLWNCFCAVATCGIIFILRVLYCIKFKSCVSKKDRNVGSFTTMIVLGSGGHTSEMMSTIKNLDRNVYKPLHFIAAKTDNRSLRRALTIEEEIGNANNVHMHQIFRCREVHQPWLFSSDCNCTLFATIRSLWQSIFLVVRIMPDIIICNGPGTCFPIVCCAVLLRVLFIKNDIQLIFLESFCRVRSLSLTGRLMYPLAHLFIVHWPQLLDKQPNAKYIGVIL